jgi:hypothetical protein
LYLRPLPHQQASFAVGSMEGGEAGASADIVPSRLWHESCLRSPLIAAL